MQNKIYAAVLISAVLLLSSCKDAWYNDLMLQGDWTRLCYIDYVGTLMHIKIDPDNFYYREESVEDWTASFTCSALGGVLYLDRPEGTIKGKYTVVWKKVMISGFKYEDGFMWLNGTWEKQPTQ
ncbi:MAG: hypothetical protein Ta2F_12760 [Termitinemataceae bacterium]|nr:MAG: hypothetical protein Ta2F_12760 [Termitinemataceae bacterium]